MGTGYIRNDTSNNIASGNVVTAADFDGEYDAIEAAFNATTGHTHDGTTSEGAPVTQLGPAQDFIASATEIKGKTTNTLDIGTSGVQFKDMYLDGLAYIDGFGESTLFATTTKVQFRDTDLYINSSVDGQLDIVGDTEVQVAAPTIDLDASTAATLDTALFTLTATTLDIDAATAVTIDTANITITGATALTGVVTVTGSAVVDNLNINGNTIISTDVNGDINITPNGTGNVVISKTDINDGTLDSVVIGGASAAAATVTDLTATGTVTFTGATVANGGAVTTVDINGGTIDGTIIGGASAAAGTFTTANATTVDTTNIEVTNIKAKDGTAAGSIADSTGVVTIASAVLTTADINGGTADAVTIGGTTPAVGTFSTANATTVDTTNIEVTTLKAKDGTSAGSIADTTGVVTIASAVLTTADINGGTADSVTIGGTTPAAGTFTTANATTVDTTNIEVTTLKAKDGTSAGSIADATGVVTLASSVLTTTDINGGTADGVVIGGASAAAATFTDITGSGTITFTGATVANGGAVTTVDINGGTIDGAIIGGASAAAITGTTIDGTTITASTGFVGDGSGLTGLPAAGIGNVVEDTTPQLGGTLDANGNSIQLDDNGIVAFGSAQDAELFTNGTDFYLDLNAGINNFIIRDATTTRFTFDDAGDFTATGDVTAYSDRSLKDDVRPITDALDKVDQINGVTFVRNDMDSDARKTGVIAQDVEAVLPEVVSTDENGIKSVAYGNMVGLLIEAVKELRKEVKTLKGEVS